MVAALHPRQHNTMRRSFGYIQSNSSDYVLQVKRNIATMLYCYFVNKVEGGKQSVCKGLQAAQHRLEVARVHPVEQQRVRPASQM
jgi:hypothetical protein